MSRWRQIDTFCRGYCVDGALQRQEDMTTSNFDRAEEAQDNTSSGTIEQRKIPDWAQVFAST